MALTCCCESSHMPEHAHPCGLSKFDTVHSDTQDRCSGRCCLTSQLVQAAAASVIALKIWFAHHKNCYCKMVTASHAQPPCGAGCAGAATAESCMMGTLRHAQPAGHANLQPDPNQSREAATSHRWPQSPANVMLTASFDLPVPLQFRALMAVPAGIRLEGPRLHSHAHLQAGHGK